MVGHSGFALPPLLLSLPLIPLTKQWIRSLPPSIFPSYQTKANSPSSNYVLLPMATIPSAIATRLEGKVALITGGASGIGECTARLLAQHGAKVVIADIQDELGQSAVHSIGQSSNSSYVHCDVTNEAHIKNAVNQTVETHGKLDIMFNIAGIIDDFKPRIVDNEKADFERVLSVNITGVFLGIKHAARVMVPARSGSIISTTSIASRVGAASTHAYCSPFFNLFQYPDDNS